MRFTIDREQFLKGLTTAAKAIGSKSPIPVMSNVKIEMTEKGLWITGSNTDLTIRTCVPFMIDNKEVIRDYVYGKTLVANKIIDIIRSIASEEVTVEVIDDTIAKISGGDYRSKLYSVRAEEYPDIDVELNGTIVSLNPEDFKTMIEQTAFAASSKNQRPILTALHLEANNCELVATATDSARLAKKTISIGSSESFVANVPATVVLEVSRLLSGVKSLRVGVGVGKIVFELDNTLVVSRLSNGEYPDTRHIVPRAFSYFLEVNAQELISAMDRVSLLSVERENVVKLTMSEDGVEVSSKSSQVGSAVESISTFQYTGDRLEISFNSSYVSQAIRATRSEDVTLAFNGEMKPFVVKNVKDESLVQVVTPVRTY